MKALTMNIAPLTAINDATIPLPAPVAGQFDDADESSADHASAHHASENDSSNNRAPQPASNGPIKKRPLNEDYSPAPSERPAQAQRTEQQPARPNGQSLETPRLDILALIAHRAAPAPIDAQANQQAMIDIPARSVADIDDTTDAIRATVDHPIVIDGDAKHFDAGRFPLRSVHNPGQPHEWYRDVSQLRITSKNTTAATRRFATQVQNYLAGNDDFRRDHKHSIMDCRVITEADAKRAGQNQSAFEGKMGVFTHADRPALAKNTFLGIYEGYLITNPNECDMRNRSLERASDDAHETIDVDNNVWNLQWAHAREHKHAGFEAVVSSYSAPPAIDHHPAGCMLKSIHVPVKEGSRGGMHVDRALTNVTAELFTTFADQAHDLKGSLFAYYTTKTVEPGEQLWLNPNGR